MEFVLVILTLCVSGFRSVSVEPSDGEVHFVERGEIKVECQKIPSIFTIFVLLCF